MSNRSLARKNRNRYKAMRSTNYNPRYKALLGIVGIVECNGNDRIYNGLDKFFRSRCRAKVIIAKANHPDATASDKLLAEIYLSKTTVSNPENVQMWGHTRTEHESFDKMQSGDGIDSNWLDGSLMDIPRPSEVLGEYEHLRNVPETVGDMYLNDLQQCFIPSPECLKAIAADYEGGMYPNYVPTSHKPTQDEKDRVWETGILTVQLDKITQEDLDKACVDGTKIK